MNEKPPKLHHEDLDVYQAAMQFLALASQSIERFPRGNGAMTEQFKRASLSIPLNIAEGYGKRTKPDRARSYDHARGSAHECGALLDAAAVNHIIESDDVLRGKTLLVRIVSMLVKMAA